MSEPNGKLESVLSTNLLITRIIVGTLASVVILFLGIFPAPRMTEGKPPAQPVIVIVGLTVAAVALAAFAVAQNVVTRMLERQVAGGAWSSPWSGPEGKFTADEGATFRWWVLYLTALIARCALLAGAALSQVVAYFIEGNLFSLGLGFGLLAVLLYQWPNRERVDRWVEARREAVERLQRGEIP
jgi:Na+/melibiose symporter-like transporter